MGKGVIISGIGHVGLILWAILGGWLFAAHEVPEIQVVDVAMISAAEFDAMVSAAPAVPDDAPEAAPVQPAPEPAVETPLPADLAPDTTTPDAEPAPSIEVPPETAPPPEPVPEPAPEPEPAPAPEPAPQPEPVPEPVPEAPAPQPEPVPDPIVPPADVPQPIQVPRSSKAPRPRPAIKIADIPLDTAPETPAVADAPSPDVNDQLTPEPPLPDVPPAQPEDATPVVTPDPPPVVEDAPVLAPTASKRPQTRPKAASAPVDDQAARDKAAADKAAQIAADQAAADKAAANKAAEAQAAQEAADQAAEQAAIDAAVAAVADQGPQGPPMSTSEIDGVRVAIKQCWNLGTLSSAAMEVKVTVRVDVGQDRKPVSASIRMSGFEGGEEAAANQVFEAARRAIIRCTKDGLPLPADKYESWKDLELVFDPTGMRLR